MKLNRLMFWRNSILQKTIILVLLITTTVLFALGAKEYRTNKKESIEDLKEKAQIVSKRLSKVLVMPLWNLETENIESALLAEMADKSIFSIIVVDSGGELAAAKKRDDNWKIIPAEKKVSDDFISRTEKILQENEEVIGNVSVHCTYKFAKKALEQSFNNILIRTLLLDSILLIAIFIIVSQSTAKPLRRVVDFAKQVSQGDLSDTLEFKRQDEIGNMADALNEMVQSQRSLIKLSNLRYLPLPIFEIDTSFQVKYINDAGALAVDNEASDCIGMNSNELFFVEGYDQCPVLSVTIEENSQTTKEVRMKIGERQNVPVTFTAIPVHDKGIVVGAIGIIVDQTSIYEIIDEVKEITTRLHTSADELSQISEILASSSVEMEAQAGVVAQSTENISKNVNSVAKTAEDSSMFVTEIASMSEEMSATFNEMVIFSKKSSENMEHMAKSGDEMSQNVNKVSISIDDMTQSLQEVTTNTKKATQIASNASKQTEDINRRMEQLVLSSKQIGKVVNMIKQIADQTNMLALNAAIEAAGAGDAGKGFAVVAGEVKELAKQSANATDQIAAQIEDIQKSTQDAVDSVSLINNIIGQIVTIIDNISSQANEQNYRAESIAKTVSETASESKLVANKAGESFDMVDKIAIGINEVAKVANEIAKHVGELSSGSREIASSTGQAAQGIQEITHNIKGINIAAEDSAKGATEVRTSSMNLSDMVNRLTEIVNLFKL